MGIYAKYVQNITKGNPWSTASGELAANRKAGARAPAPVWVGFPYGNGITLGVPFSYVTSEVIEQLNVTGVSRTTAS
jgi:hypothetical protein